MNQHVSLSTDVDERRDHTRSRLRNGLIAILLLAIIAYAGSRFLGGKAPPAAAAPASVTVATPIARDVTQWDDYIGRFAASQAVEVRPRVSGQIAALHFKDGDFVRKGQLLFTIDQRPFLAAQAEARADVASARSAVDLAHADLARATRLTGDEALSGSEVDQLRAKSRAAEAALAAAEARLRVRALDVEWSQVRAPISGRISDRRADVGNLVAGGQGNTGTLLTTIDAIDPIYFSFDASEALFLKAQRDREQGRGATAVQIRLQDEPGYAWTGALDFTDNALDPRSGTIRGRATIANPKGFLRPGLFGNMRLASGGKVRALLVPDAAIQTDQTRKSVLVVGPDGVVITKPVEIGAVVDGLRIVRSGLAPKDRVIIAGMQMATPGSKVEAHPGRVTPDAAPPAAETTPLPAQATFAN